MKQNTAWQKTGGILRDTEAAYRRLHSSRGIALQTSVGRLFNNTFFGRDSAIESLLLIGDGYDPETALNVVLNLAKLQGTRFRRLSNEEPGKIHHEWRDFSKWQASTLRKISFRLLSLVWGGSTRKFCTYFSQDSTGLFLQLVEQVVEHEGHELLGRAVRRNDGKEVTLGQCVIDAANWIASKQTACGLVADKRSNPFSLFFHVFEDSLTSYKHQDGELANIKAPLAFLDVQSVSVSGLLAAARLHENYRLSASWRNRAETIASATLKHMWSKKDDFFVGAVGIKDGQPCRQVDSIGINAGWLLGGALLRLLPAVEQRKVTEAVVRRLFAKDFLSNAGVRNRSLLFGDSPPGVHAYHGSQTVWPLCNFVLAEGLRRAGLPKLAAEIDARVINSLRFNGNYAEFFIVLSSGQIIDTSKTGRQRWAKKVSIQMKPEQQIGLSIITALLLERRLADGPVKKPATQPSWAANLEKELLRTVPHITPQTNPYILTHLLPVAPYTTISTSKGRRQTTYYLLHQLLG